MSFKALSLLVLQGNHKGNYKETLSFPAWKPECIFQETRKPILPTSAPADNHPGDWRPTFHARLQGDVLMISGVTDDLAGEIIKLTADDLPLQRRLLKLHCGTYSGPWWSRLVERWQERAGIMQYDGGLTREDAEHQAAACLRAEMFIDELRAAP